MGARRRPRVLMQPLHQVLNHPLQALDDGLQRCHASFEGADVVLDCRRGLVPQLWGEQAVGRNGLRWYAPSLLAGKSFLC
jgi:hypothetical protein